MFQKWYVKQLEHHHHKKMVKNTYICEYFPPHSTYFSLRKDVKKYCLLGGPGEGEGVECIEERIRVLKKEEKKKRVKAVKKEDCGEKVKEG